MSARARIEETRRKLRLVPTSSSPRLHDALAEAETALDRALDYVPRTGVEADRERRAQAALKGEGVESFGAALLDAVLDLVVEVDDAASDWADQGAVGGDWTREYVAEMLGDHDAALAVAGAPALCRRTPGEFNIAEVTPYSIAQAVLYDFLCEVAEALAQEAYEDEVERRRTDELRESIIDVIDENRADEAVVFLGDMGVREAYEVGPDEREEVARRFGG